MRTKAQARIAEASAASLSPAALRMAVGIVGFAAASAAAAHVRIPLPFTPVPITLQTAVALVAGATMGIAGGGASQLLYLAVGALGAPVFTNSGALSGPTAGYLVGFVPAAMAVGISTRGGFVVWRVALGMLAATAVIYACGVAGLIATSGMSCRAAIAAGVVPFVPGDALKLAAALGISRVTVPVWCKWRGN
jgi:biotin transport system substrate-specific component